MQSSSTAGLKTRSKNNWSPDRDVVSPTLFQIFLQRMITDASEDHEGTVSTGGRTITNLRFADDIDGLAGEKEERSAPSVTRAVMLKIRLNILQQQAKKNRQASQQSTTEQSFKLTDPL